ncbi:hypothetical protein HBI37_114820 [Parastagonospora nodorum]|nr:hypothetical protein HBI37_114820 [Parastagonospora nodorum]KAH6371604.1 hypothetical protein HBI36_012280 [Parastagonospora nodorum]
MSQPTLTGAPSLYPPSSFPTHLTATCLCTAIRVTITDSELFTRPRGHLCHCSNCRKVAGSYVSSNLAIEKEKVSVEDPKGVMKRYRDMQTGSGNPIMSIAEIFPTMVIVKMGMFPRIPQPECESFAAHRHEWQGKHEGLVQYEIARGGKKLGQGT